MELTQHFCQYAANSNRQKERRSLSSILVNMHQIQTDKNKFGAHAAFLLICSKFKLDRNKDGAHAAFLSISSKFK